MRITWHGTLKWFFAVCFLCVNLLSCARNITTPQPAISPRSTSIASDCTPGPDSDSDGVPDWRDKCPREQETYNNFMDGDGCPDNSHRIIETHPSIDYTIVIDNNMKFQDIPESDIDSIAGRLQQYRKRIRLVEISWQICQNNIELNDYAKKIADTVKCQLIHHGISPERLIIGQNRPTTDCRSYQYIFFHVLNYDDTP